MKKLLLIVSTLVLALGLSACKEKDPVDEGVTSVTLSGYADVTINVGDSINVYDGVVATGSDGVDYSDLIQAASDNCSLTATGGLSSSIPAVCKIDYSVVVDGKMDRKSAYITFEKEEVVVGEDAPLVIGWSFEDDSYLTGWDIYVDGGGAVTPSIEDGALKLEVISSTNVYGSRWSFMGIPLQNGEDYVVKFKAKSSVEGKAINLQAGELLPAPTYFLDFKPGQSEVVTLTTEWAEYSYTFTMDIDNANGGILFEMGNVGDSIGIDATIWFDYIEVRGGSDEDTRAPEISGAENTIVYLGDAFDSAEGVTASDYVDGSLTSSMVISGDTVNVNVAGDYTVTYTVSDAAGNEQVVNRVITVMADTEGPVFAGTDDVIVPINADFDVLDGVTAIDNRDGDISANIVVTGDAVDTAVAGDYSVIYTATDALGNESTVTRLVKVNAMIFNPTNLLINGTFDASGWMTWMADWNSTSATFAIENETIVLDIADVGAENWNIQLFQEGFNLVNGQEYS
ncbi:MAG: DUF5011 domain-containing protein, partial [Bacilli bacterium]|nr:DUF5011 domain-containing protein [Bacilli bacterium]